MDGQKDGLTDDNKTISLRLHRGGGGGGGGTSTKQRIKCHAQEHKTVFQVRLETTIPRSWVKHSTTARLRSSAREHIV